ncbi:unnamed protein product [Paramecium sonneborni]|uniref:Uncharacterized protein n=1 Tax=Paramecium sonneborni TaxID=65129 RepID=A0A8S1NZ25_9CILI|nr:unnamed protein product [Paramecium sonneborni]
MINYAILKRPFWKVQSQILQCFGNLNNHRSMKPLTIINQWIQLNQDLEMNESRPKNWFFIVGYQISIGLSQNNQLQYIIKLEEVLIDDLNWTYLGQYLFVIFQPLIFLYKSLIE